MSSFIVSDETINRVVYLLSQRHGRPCGDSWMDYVDDNGQPKPFGEYWGDKLLALNAAATAHRYGDQPEPQEPFKWRPATYSDMEILKAANCWLYQCSEGEKFTGALIFSMVRLQADRLQARIISELPEYRAVEWNPEQRRSLEVSR